MKRILILLFLITGCAKSGRDLSPNSISYFSYEKYDFINNLYIPYGQLVMLENNNYFSITKEDCSNKTYQIDSKTIDSNNNNVHYELSSVESNPSPNPCFADSISIELKYINDDGSKIYYESTLFGDLYHLFKTK